jgi:hypothetical protein
MDIGGPQSIKNRNVIFVALLATALAINVIVFCLFYTVGNDLWGHALHGRIIFEQGRLPQFSDYSCVTDDHIPRHFNGGLQIFIYLLLTYIGYPGVMLSKMMLIGLTCVFIVKALRVYTIPLRYAIPACLIFILMGSSRFMMRGDTFTMLFWAAYFALLERFYKAPGRYIWWLALLQLIWANMHQLAIMGLGLIGLYAAACYLAKKTNQARTLLLLFVVDLAVSFCNISGYAQLCEPFRMLYDLPPEARFVFEHTVEFISLSQTFSATTIYAYWGMTILLLLSFLATHRDRLWHHWLLFAGVAYFSWRHCRFIGIFAISTSILIPIYCQRIWQKYCTNLSLARWCQRRSHHALAPLSFLVALLFANLIPWCYYTYDGWCAPSNLYVPVEAVKFLRRHQFTGNIFTDHDTGGYVGYSLYPQCRIFINSLGLTAYSPEHYQLYYNLYTGKRMLWPIVVACDIEVFVIFHNISTGWRWLKQIGKDPDWVLLYADEGAVVMGRKESRFTEKVMREDPFDCERIRHNPRLAAVPNHLFLFGNALLNLNRLQEAKVVCTQSLAMNPSDDLKSKLLTNEGLLAAFEGDFERALPLFIRSAEFAPGYGPPLDNMRKLFRDHIVFHPNNPLHQKAKTLCQDSIPIQNR